MELKTLNVNTIPMKWFEQGQGYPVVLVHGIPTSPTLWRYVVPLIPNARSIVWEMVGYGSSRVQGRGRDISVAKQAQYLADFLDEIGITRAIFAGHDLGGGVIQILAIRRPELFAGLMLTNSISYDSWPIPSVKSLRSFSSILKRLPSVFLKPILKTMFIRGHRSLLEGEEAMSVHWPLYASRFGMDAFIRQIRSLEVQDTLTISNRLTELNVPARIVWGEADPFQKIEYGERLASDLNAKLHRIPEGKHFTPEDHPEEIAKALQELLSEVCSSQNNPSKEGEFQ
ncbi:MAG: oxidoreductase [Methylotenera sp.]|nr:MAG: oxidoreductase [Methylotenera sp.]